MWQRFVNWLARKEISRLKSRLEQRELAHAEDRQRARELEKLVLRQRELLRFSDGLHRL